VLQCKNREKDSQRQKLLLAFCRLNSPANVLFYLEIIRLVLFRFDWKPTAGQTLIHSTIRLCLQLFRLIIRPRNAIAFVISSQHENKEKPFWFQKGAGLRVLAALPK